MAEAAQPALAYCSLNNKFAIYIEKVNNSHDGSTFKEWLPRYSVNLTELGHRDVRSGEDSIIYSQ